MRLDTEGRRSLRGLRLVARAVAEEPAERRAEREAEPLEPCGRERQTDVAEVMLRDAILAEGFIPVKRRADYVRVEEIPPVAGARG